MCIFLFVGILIINEIDEIQFYIITQFNKYTIQQFNKKNYHGIRASGLTVWSVKSFFKYL